MWMWLANACAFDHPPVTRVAWRERQAPGLHGTGNDRGATWVVPTLLDFPDQNGSEVRTYETNGPTN